MNDEGRVYRSKTGKKLVSGDPHLALGAPNVIGLPDRDSHTEVSARSRGKGLFHGMGDVDPRENKDLFRSRLLDEDAIPDLHGVAVVPALVHNREVSTGRPRRQIPGTGAQGKVTVERVRPAAVEL